MAKTHLLLPLFAILLTIVVTDYQAYSDTLPPPYKQQKLTHLHFYLHDIVSGKNPSAVVVEKGQGTNTSFGMVVVIDDPLTEGPDPNSMLVGRAQGMYASASQSEMALMMDINLVFTEGEINGSTLSLFGRNPIFSAMREMPIVGGSGVFRFARGYAQAKTHTFDVTSGDAVVEYDVYALQYY